MWELASAPCSGGEMCSLAGVRIPCQVLGYSWSQSPPRSWVVPYGPLFCAEGVGEARPVLWGLLPRAPCHCKGDLFGFFSYQ